MGSKFWWHYGYNGNIFGINGQNNGQHYFCNVDNFQQKNQHYENNVDHYENNIDQFQIF